jgi:uncharacterized protein YndB with AHSA1/START domain
MLGDLRVRDNDKYQLVFTRKLAHPREKVWKAITEGEHMQHWFPDEMRGERAVGAHLEFVPDGHEDLKFEGEMLAFEPPSLMEFLWGEDTIRIELASDGDGTVLTLVDTFTELGKAARDGAGWHVCLDNLVHHLDGTEADVDQETRWKGLNQEYIDALGPAAATVGVPEGYTFDD